MDGGAGGPPREFKNWLPSKIYNLSIVMSITPCSRYIIIYYNVGKRVDKVTKDKELKREK